MIVGDVAATREIMVSLAVRGANGASLAVRAVVDTGFGGHLMIPPATVTALGLTQSGTVPVILGDGTEAYLPEYKAVVVWDGRDRIIPVYASSDDSDPLVGMELLYGFDFHVHVVDGGMVALNRLP